MYAFPLNQSSPNQSFTTVVDGFTFDITLQTAFGILFATVDIDGVRVKTSCRCINQQWIVPYPAYLPEGCGNFMFLVNGEQYPNYGDFNSTCVLVYFSADEIKEMQNAS